MPLWVKWEPTMKELLLFIWVDARKRYTAWFPRHKAVHQNTHWRLILSCDADWPTKHRTAFWRQRLLRLACFLAVWRNRRPFEASQVGRHPTFCTRDQYRFLAEWEHRFPQNLTGYQVGPDQYRSDHKRPKSGESLNFPTIKAASNFPPTQPWNPRHDCRPPRHVACIDSFRTTWLAATALMMLTAWCSRTYVRERNQNALDGWQSRGSLSPVFSTHTLVTSIIDPPLGGSMRVA